ncbi:MAG: tRNA (adenosine(37)-N6)-threonylcarbamoyltransferase complex transferase subunit TsaD [Anaerovoracaceae bacterium]|nr:tRNA (adenosine(37)-N6)-threonylcarbamoyltransferase complex transferase subunit TsaD [Anaerovoracaceae bacterium]
MIDGRTLGLAIETSCDETSVALSLDGRSVLSNIISSQIAVHTQFGGVVPEIASRHHLENINAVTDRCFDEASAEAGRPVTMEDVDFIAVTYGPGLVGALLIGVATAKAYALAAGKPLIGVNHMQGHISACFIEHKDLEPPFMSLVVSGGHTNIVQVDRYNHCVSLGQTRDDAAGEAFDKVARVIGLGYPGGPKIDRISDEGDPQAVKFKRVFLEEGSMDFSFSGIKTGVLNYVNSEKQKGHEINTADVAASFQQAVLDVIVAKAVRAASGPKRLAVAGGVASNRHLRKMLTAECEKRGIELFFPSPVYCTDNAAMIGCAGYYKFLDGEFSDLTLDAVPGLPIEA